MPNEVKGWLIIGVMLLLGPGLRLWLAWRRGGGEGARRALVAGGVIVLVIIGASFGLAVLPLLLQGVGQGWLWLVGAPMPALVAVLFFLVITGVPMAWASQYMVRRGQIIMLVLFVLAAGLAFYGVSAS